MTTTKEALTLGLQYHRAGRLPEAEALYWQVLNVEPDNADALHLMGVLAHQIGRDDVAVPYLENALALKPDRPHYHGNLAEALRALGRLDLAGFHFQQALALEPDFADAHNNYGLLLQDLGQLDPAIEHYRRALELVPAFPEAHINLGNALKGQRLLDQAVSHYRQALAFQPDSAEAHTNLADTLMEQGKREQAVSHYRQALAFRPDFLIARFGLCMAQLPVLYRDRAEIETCRAAYHRALLDLRDAVAGEGGDPRAKAAAVGSHQPFFLAYQGQNDRELQAIYGGLVVRAMEGLYPPGPELAAPLPGEPIRVGIVCGYFFNHSVWKMPLKGWLTRLDTRRFRLFCYHTRLLRDAETELAEQTAEVFVQGPLPLDQWREQILIDAPHVLIYPEIGMDPMTAKLAAQRLARVQCTSWGHPETCGLPTIDYYLSSDLMEPPGAASHYTETLVRLPNLSVYYEPPALPDLAPGATVTRAELGLRPDEVVFWCCQSLFKYLPQHDPLLVRIASQVGPCRFVFLDYQGGAHVGQLFRERLAAAFATAGLSAQDHCLFLPRLTPERFIAVGRVCDVYLDSLGWSGINTMLETALTDIPMVTHPGDTLRGRHGAAVLRMMAVPETIAETLDDYVTLATRLATDLPWRDHIRRKMAEGRERVYRDEAPIQALEDFLTRAVGG